MAEAKEVILVIGGTGKIGTGLVHLLASDGTAASGPGRDARCDVQRLFPSEIFQLRVGVPYRARR